MKLFHLLRMDRAGNHHVKWNKPDSEKNTACFLWSMESRSLNTNKQIKVHKSNQRTFEKEGWVRG
jgi:hypothetical protein